MQYILVFFHIIACFVLILVILLQAGKGGGLSEMFGGAMRQNEKLFGTETNTFLTRATAICAVVFIVTSISLGVITTRKSQSLVDTRRLQSVIDELQKKTPPVAESGEMPGGEISQPTPAPAEEAPEPPENPS